MIRHVNAFFYNFNCIDTLVATEYIQTFLQLIIENKESIICRPTHFCSVFEHYIMVQQTKDISFFNQNKKFFEALFFYVKTLLSGKFMGKEVYIFLLSLWTMLLKRVDCCQANLYIPGSLSDQLIEKSKKLLFLYGYNPSFMLVYCMPSLIGGFRLEIENLIIEFSMQRVISDIIKKIENGG